MSRQIVRVADVRYTYPGGAKALDGISFNIAESEAVAIVGPNGAGKSTLLGHLVGWLLPDSGTIHIGDTPVASRTLAAVRQAVGMVFQDPDDQLFMPTVFDDVAFGPANMGLPSEQVRKLAEEALATVGMSHLAARPPYRLSGGEKRAVSIATVLAMSPDVLVMDEPSSGLDPRARRNLIRLLAGFGHTRIIATHDLEMVVELCARVIVMDKGQIVAEGRTPEILGDAELMLEHGLERPHILDPHHPPG